jgi:putative ABC transport system ATP-binding protein
VRFAYRSEDVLHIPALTVTRGERLFLFGPSGSGKTTLLGLLAGLLQVQAGNVTILGHDLTAMSGAQRDRFRGLQVGYIFQMFNLIPYLNVFDNIALPCRLHPQRAQRLGNQPLTEAIPDLADRLGIRQLLPAQVLHLSVGQQQRVAAARALLGNPPLLLADEPTSALDTDRREQFLHLLFETCAERGTTIIFVSHDRALGSRFDRGLSLPAVNTISRTEEYGPLIARYQITAQSSTHH